MLAIFIATIVAAPAGAQALQTNGATHALQFDAAAATAIGSAVPVTLRTFTGTPVTINIQGGTDAGGNAAQPLVLLYSASNTAGTTISPEAFFGGGVRLDLVDIGNVGYQDQIIVNGFSDPAFGSTDSNGLYSLTVALPTCEQDPLAEICTTQAFSEISVQAVVVDATNPPFSLESTGAGTLEVVDGFEELPLVPSMNEQFSNIAFRDGFTFNFYGTTYTDAFVSENGYIQFGSASQLSTFPNLIVASVLGAPPRIMCFFDDLVVAPSGGASPRIYAEHFIENGDRKVKFVFENLQEFADQTGPHGGQITLVESGEIAILVDGSNAFPDLNTMVGISSGMALSVQTGPGFSLDTGRDLSAGIGMGQSFGAGRSVFELFDHGSFISVTNPLDLIGLDTGNAVGPGFALIPDPSLIPPTSGYIIQ